MMDGKTAVVTGAASGIGLASARRLANAGVTVIGLDRKVGVLSLDHDHPNLTGLRCDVTNAAQIAATLDGSLDGRVVDILVNNAGINPSPSSLAETSEAVWQQLVETNLTAVYRVTRAVLPRMETGAIINISSILGIAGARRNAAYAATKGAIISLTRAMARDHGPGIRVNCICPGAVQTDMFEDYLARCDDPERERRRILATLPLQRLGTPEDIANAVWFLTSDLASWITGHVLVVDGGDSA